MSKPLRVVVAEDETIIRIDIVETLALAGYQVVGEASNGRDAIELAEQHHPDVVVMDISMPVLDGISATEEITQQRLAPVVILTAFSQPEHISRGKEAGAMAYIVKPFNETDLIPAIELAVARFEELRALEDEVADLSERFNTRKVVEKAKNILMKAMDLDEPAAFRWIQKTSMDRRMSMKEVAQTVVKQMG